MIIFRSYLELIRFNRPIGTLLLLWSTLSALVIASQGMPNIKIMIIFILGVFLTRASGCIVNDLADKKFDFYVKRTQNRPLVSGALSVKQAVYFFVILIFCCLFLVLQLNITTILLSFVALFLMILYPYTKRFFPLPQLFLGLAWSWSTVMAFTAVDASISLICVLLFLANWFWTVAYDTIYGMVDMDDDVYIGVNSTAVFFKDNTFYFVLFCQCVTVLIWSIIGYILEYNLFFYGSLCAMVLSFCYQDLLITQQKRALYLKAFLSNHWIGLLLLISIIFQYQ